MKKVKQRILSAVLACAMAVPGFSAGSLGKASAAEANWKFDFGGGGVASGYTGVSASTGYNASTGFGIANTSGVKDVAASGSGALSDAVQFTSEAANKYV